MSAYSIATRGLAGRKIPQGVLAAINTLLFASGEQGAWYDPSDLSTLFQDTAGTTPVTAVEQAVALMLDKSGRGNHASQATSTKRPKYSRRVNLLTKTEQFDDAVWVVNTLGGANCTKAANATVAPNGTLTADLITSTGLVNDFIYQTPPLAAGSAVTLSLYVKNNDSAAMSVMARTSVTSLSATINWTGSVLSSITLITGTSASFVDVGSGWYRVSLSFTTGEANQFMRIFPGIGYSVYLWGACLTLATDSHLPYQWVNTATDYDADPAKFPAYLHLDSVDDAMATIGNVDLSSAQQLAAVSGYCVTKDAGTSLLAELTDVSITAGAFSLFVRQASGVCGWSIASPQMLPSSAVRPLAENTVNAVCFDRGGASTEAVFKTLRLNGENITPTFPFSSQTPTFANAPLFLFARNNGTTHFMGGRFYGLIVRGAESSLSQIEAAELYIKQKMRLP